MAEKDYKQRSQEIVDQFRNSEYTITLDTIAGPEVIGISWKKVGSMAGKDSYQVVLKNPYKQEVGTVDYSVDRSVKPPRAVIDHKFVAPAYRGQDIAKKMMELVMKELENQEITRVYSKIRKENAPAIASQQRVREMLTGRMYKSEQQQSADQQQFYEVTNLLDQFEEDEQ